MKHGITINNTEQLFNFFKKYDFQGILLRPPMKVALSNTHVSLYKRKKCENLFYFKAWKRLAFI